MHAERLPQEEEGRDWSDPSTSHGTPKIARKPPDASWGARNRSPLMASARTNLANTWIPDFWPPELQDNKYLLSKSLSLWYFVRATLTDTARFCCPFWLERQNNSADVGVDLHVLRVLVERARRGPFPASKRGLCSQTAWVRVRVRIVTCQFCDVREVYLTLGCKMGMITYLFRRVVMTSELIHLQL